ncbi:MAG: hypothetical protein O3B73_18605, partial [bacterium]|nr:hypothetical protein [bacterium]
SDEKMVLAEAFLDRAVDGITVNDKQGRGEGGCNKRQMRLQEGRQRNEKCFQSIHRARAADDPLKNWAYLKG